jgi:hypothetical protein
MSTKVVLPEGIGEDSSELSLLVGRFNEEPSLERLWQLVDEAWLRHGCDNRLLDPSCISSFYGDPVWILNGLYTEIDSMSMDHRHAIAEAITSLKPLVVLDFGGGFGTLARLLAAAVPQAEISICEPYPPRHGVLSCKPFPNIPEAFTVFITPTILHTKLAELFVNTITHINVNIYFATC